MTTSEFNKERLQTIASWRTKYSAGHNVVLPAEEAEMMARALLAVIGEQPAPIMPNEMNPTTIRAVAAEWGHELDDDEANAAADSWNACRTAMLNGGKP